MTRPSRQGHWDRGFCAVAFLFAFSLTSALLGRLAGYPDVGDLSEKLRFFAERKDTYELLFVGSSRVYQGIVPVLFDEQAAARDLALRSFNFGILGMKPHEANALVRRVLAMRPARLRWIVVELGDWDPVIDRRNRFKRRGILWHDAAETVSALRSTLLLDALPLDRADHLMSHALHFAARSLAVGRGPDVARCLLGRGENPADEDGITQWQGFKPFKESSYKYNPLRKRFLKRLDEYRDQVRQLATANAEESVSLASYNAAALEAQIAMIRRAGVEPVYLITPSPQATPELCRLQRQGNVPALLAFNRPQAYPELFAVERRFDREHLTQEGAERFTRLLASRFVDEVARPGAAKAPVIAAAR